MSWINKIFGKKEKPERPGGPHSNLHCYTACEDHCMDGYLKLKIKKTQYAATLEKLSNGE